MWNVNLSAKLVEFRYLKLFDSLEESGSMGNESKQTNHIIWSADCSRTFLTRASLFQFRFKDADTIWNKVKALLFYVRSINTILFCLFCTGEIALGHCIDLARSVFTYKLPSVTYRTGAIFPGTERQNNCIKLNWYLLADVPP